jgi:tetratricopeptide (TPR) repeat protein
MVLITITASAIGALLWTEAARREAFYQSGLAQSARGKAIDNLRLAQDLNRSIFNELAASTLAEIPGGEPLRRKLAQTASSLNGRFLVEEPRNISVRTDVAAVEWTLGRLFSLANEPVSAEDHFHRALDFARGVVNEVPYERQTTAKYYCFQLAEICLGAAAMYRERGRHTQALLLLDEALGGGGLGHVLEFAAKVRKPGMKYTINHFDPWKTEGRIKLEQAWIHLNEGRYTEALTRFDALVVLFRTVVDQLDEKAAQKQVAESPGGVYKDDVLSLAQSLCGLAIARDKVGRSSEAEDSFGEAIRRLERFDHSESRLALAETLTRRGVVRAAAPQRRQGAEADFDRALAVNERLMHDLGETVMRLRVKGVTLLGRGTLRAFDGPTRRADATADLQAARAILEPLVSNSEGQPAVCDLVDLAGAKAGLAALARDRGAQDESRKLMADAERLINQALAICPEHASARHAQERMAVDLKRLTQHVPSSNP